MLNVYTYMYIGRRGKLVKRNICYSSRYMYVEKLALGIAL